MSRRVLAIVGRVVLLCWLSASGGCLDIVVGIGEHNDRIERARARQARVEVAGAVQDEHGQPLRGVRVTQLRQYFVVVGIGAFAELQPREDAGTRTVNGAFRFRWNKVNTVRLRFEKEGHLPVELCVHVADEDVPAGSPPAEPVSKTEVVVTLRKAGGDSN